MTEPRKERKIQKQQNNFFNNMNLIKKNTYKLFGITKPHKERTNTKVKKQLFQQHQLKQETNSNTTWDK